MDPFEAFNQSAESNRGNYDPFMAFNKAAGMDQISNVVHQQAQQVDKHFPLVRVSIPGSRDILTKALQLDQTTGIPFQPIVEGGQMTITPGIVAGFLPSNILTFNPSVSDSDLYVWATCTIQDGSVNSVVLNSGGTLPIPQTISQNSPPNLLNIPIGMYAHKNNKTFNFISANWISLVSTVAFSTTDSTGSSTSWYYWTW